MLPRHVVIAAGVAGLVALVPAAPGTAAPAPAPRSPAAPYLAARIPIAPGCFTVGPAWAGVKVHLVQARLGTTAEKERYGPATQAAVVAFQRARGLPVTGRVDARTWRRLGITADFCLDRYTEQPALSVGAKSRARVEAMIGFAARQLGRPYLWGAAGPIGFDCSGLVLQAMYAGGLVVPAVTTYLHQQRTFVSSATMYQRAGMTRVPLAQRQRGDLVFFGVGGRVSHMAIYLGDGRILEAVRPRIRVSPLAGHSLPVMPLVVRPFP